MKRLLRRVLFPVAAAALAATLFGCAKDDGDVTNPNPEVLKPKGTVQGLLRDRVTLEPIVGAVVDIGVAKATTTQTGQFVMRDVPVNDNGEDYAVTIDLRGVSSPVDMRSQTTAVKYPQFSYDTVSLGFTSLDDTSGDVPGAGSGSNHDTPVVGLVATMWPTVGKLSTSIKGCVLVGSTLEPVADADAFVVTLTTVGGSANSASGANGNEIKKATVVGGQYTFTNVEAGRNYRVSAVSADGTWASDDSVALTTGADGTTVDLSCTTGSCDALLVKPIDECDPVLLSVSVENGQDLAPADNQAIVFTFSEPIAASVYADALTADLATLGGLWNDVTVTSAAKGDAVTGAPSTAHTLSWSADRKSLTVTIAKTVASASYTVSIAEALDDDDLLLTDEAGNEVDPNGLATVTFTTTYGGQAAVAPVVAVAGPLDWDDTPELDWNPAAGAKSYDVYCAVNQVWGTSVNAHASVLVGETEASGFADDSKCGLCEWNNDIEAPEWICPDFLGDGTFVEDGAVQLTFTYTVKSVNSDGLASEASAAVTASDEVAPEVTSYTFTEDFGALPAADAEPATADLVIQFSEPMNEAAAETLTNYTIAAGAGALDTDVEPTVVAAEYDPANAQVTLTLSLDGSAGGTYAVKRWDLTLTAANLVDVAGNALNADAETTNVFENGVALITGFVQINPNAAKSGFGATVADNTVHFEWDALADAASYQLVVTKLVDGEILPVATVPLGALTYADYAIASTDFVSGQSKATLLFFVEALNDGLTVGRSATLSVSDTEAPALTAGPLNVTTTAADDKYEDVTFELTFDEPVQLLVAETIGSYAYKANDATPAATAMQPQLLYADMIDVADGIADNNVRITVRYYNPKDAGADDDVPYLNWVITANMLDIAGNPIDPAANEWANAAFPVRVPAVTANPF